MTKLYKTSYKGLRTVAIMVNQQPADKVNAPEHTTLNDADGNALQVKCSDCEATYVIGYPTKYAPPKSFETLAEDLLKHLASAHSLQKSPTHPSILELDR